MKGEVLDASYCEKLAERAASGDADAQRQLVEYLWPWWLKQVRASKSMARMARSEDHVREVASRVTAKLSRKGGHALRLYPLWRQSHPSSDFGDWMRIVVANVVRDYVREQIGNAPISDGEISPKRLLNELTRSIVPEGAGVRPPYTAAQAVRQILEFAHGHLPPAQVLALKLWLEGATDDELDMECGTSRGGGRELMRAGVAALRRRFTPP